MTAYALLALLYLLWACIAAIAVKSAVELVREFVRPAATTERQPRTGKPS